MFLLISAISLSLLYFIVRPLYSRLVPFLLQLSIHEVKAFLGRALVALQFGATSVFVIPGHILDAVPSWLNPFYRSMFLLSFAVFMFLDDLRHYWRILRWIYLRHAPLVAPVLFRFVRLIRIESRLKLPQISWSFICCQVCWQKCVTLHLEGFTVLEFMCVWHAVVA